MKVRPSGIKMSPIEFEIVDALEEYLDSRTRIDADTGCWLWTGKPDRDGYGQAYWRGRTYRAHRLSYAHRVGQIPAGTELDHTCETRNCIRPDHLEPVTTRENRVRHYTRMGVSREHAERMAAQDLERWAKEAAVRRGAREAVAAAGIKKRDRVWVGRKRAVWIVVEWEASQDGSVLVTLRSEEHAKWRTARLGELILVRADP